MVAEPEEDGLHAGKSLPFQVSDELVFVIPCANCDNDGKYLEKLSTLEATFANI